MQSHKLRIFYANRGTAQNRRLRHYTIIRLCNTYMHRVCYVLCVLGAIACEAKIIEMMWRCGLSTKDTKPTEENGNFSLHFSCFCSRLDTYPGYTQWHGSTSAAAAASAPNQKHQQQTKHENDETWKLFFHLLLLAFPFSLYTKTHKHNVRRDENMKKERKKNRDDEETSWKRIKATKNGMKQQRQQRSVTKKFRNCIYESLLLDGHNEIVCEWEWVCGVCARCVVGVGTESFVKSNWIFEKAKQKQTHKDTFEVVGVRGGGGGRGRVSVCPRCDAQQSFWISHFSHVRGSFFIFRVGSRKDRQALNVHSWSLFAMCNK